MFQSIILWFAHIHFSYSILILSFFKSSALEWDSCSDDDNTVNGLFADWMGISHCASVNLEINGITCDRTFQSMVDQGMSWVFADVDAALAAGDDDNQYKD